ncbi:MULTISPECIES: acetoacetate decarboxylase family protein [unclassified Tenacibaculum]|uniref:acetoacetate decarboxylase family protein n=1 Tax=unclassified Tenacibaculum TaxID=2635139 RepID=UPI001F3D2DFB|nr:MULTISPECIES: acetoacetate decarboxylase family protein [unclassified Tenacibaculum]MCF2873232.1 acetoacetate decarboxylase family protein [Tenacibaculum sp. Cn5-1]MCF2933388.1 acetoacetate decarboxylase family protein [Tenacibaculum sp. Cn5-34]MCG7510031.1 acetoacetate decarboxylase family protein [Tenacibaculum sp. Cn5-46]
MNKLNLTLLFLISVVFLSCNENDNPPESIVIANFETEILLGENQAIVALTNLSQNATTYKWSSSDGVIENTTDDNTSIYFTENGTYQITLVASNGVSSNTKTIDFTIDNITNSGYTPYRYLENDGIFMYYETDNVEVYKSLIPDEFNMPSRMIVFAFFNDFYKLDFGATPYKENAISILVEYQGQEFFHCVYMPVTDEHSMRAGIIGLGLPKTMGDINFFRNTPLYYGYAENQLGGTMNMSINTENYNISNDVKQEMINLQLLKSLQIRNGKIIVVGNTGGNENSVIQTANQYPNLITLKFGKPSITTNTDAISFNHPLDLKPSRIIGGFYLKNTIPFGLTGNAF